jgi:general secretion pathway protein K
MAPAAREATLGAGAGERGFALLIVLWIFVVLFAIGAEFAQGMRDNATATRNFAEETQSYYLATAAANRTFYRVLRARDEGILGATPQELGEDAVPGAQGTQGVPADGEWYGQGQGGNVCVRLIDEGAKISLNTSQENLLRLVLKNLGLDADAAAALSDSILDWIDKDHDHRLNGAESEYYEGLPRPYKAKDAPFDALEELLLVKGVTPELFYGGNETYPVGLIDVFSVFNHYGTVNVHNMTPKVMRTLFALDDKEMEEMKKNQKESAATLLPLLQTHLPDPTIAGLLSDEAAPNIVTVEVQAKYPDTRVPAHVAGVIDVGGSEEGIYVLRWVDQLPVVDVECPPEVGDAA